MKEEECKYGIVVKMMAVAGKRDELIALTHEGRARELPGNISYVVSKDRDDENGIWITEYWETEEAHTASMENETVKHAIARGMPFIAGFEHRAELVPTVSN